MSRAENGDGGSRLNLSLRRLMLFQAVAKHRHFGRAAQELFVSPTSLSEQIRKLEDEIGIQLFDRTPRGAQLTQEGQVLLESAGRIIREADRFDALVGSILRGSRDKIRLGFVPLAAGPLTAVFVRRFEDDFKQFELELISVDFSEQNSSVQSSEIDACIARGPLDLTGLRFVKLVSEPRMVMISVSNRMAKASYLTIEDLQSEPRVTRTNVPNDWHNWWSLDPSPNGTSPPYGPSVLSFEEQIELAAIDRAISIVPASATFYYHRPDIAFIPIRDAPPSEVFLCARADRDHPGVDALFDVARSTYSATSEG
ncbi:LysR family transcriptional regulator [Rhodococcus sp. NPDC127530]|uniref:LysR family transcriptional regulator n=1 Tax=unclassified Rhodococcus (in: high G+C Gram-positive bacteria) TaxID=192944 RepID=UPI0036292356